MAKNDAKPVDGGGRYSHPWAVGSALALLGVVILLQLASPLPDLLGLDGRERPFARGRFFGQMLATAVAAPDIVASDWAGGEISPWLADRLPVAGVAGAILGASAAVGWILLVASGIRRRLSAPEQFAFACGVGLQVVSLAVLAAGLAGWLGTMRWPAVVVGIAAVGVWFVVWRRLPPADPTRLPSADLGKNAIPTFGIVWLWLAVPLVIAILLGGMLPPIDFDVREYHLQAPKEFFQQGQISFLPHNVYANMPLGGEMFALLGMVLTGDWWIGALVGKVVLAAFAPMTAVALFAAGSRFAGRSAGVAAAIVYLSIPWVIRLSNVGLNEVAYGFYLFLAVYAAVLWKQTGLEKQQVPGNATDGIWFVVSAGFFAGAAVSVKYTAVVFVAFPLAAAVLWTSWHARSSLKSRFNPLLLFAAALLLSSGLWFAKNAWQSGNPTYPLAYRVFGGETRTDAMDAQWRRGHRPDGYWPGDAAFDLTGIAWRSAWQSPLVVPLALIPIFVRRMRPLAAPWWWFAAVILACWWLLTHRVDRFWTPILPVLALLAGIGAAWTSDRIWRIGLRIIVVSWIVAVTIFAVAPQMFCGYTRFLASYQWLRTAEERVPAWRVAVDRGVPSGHAVLAVGDAEVFDHEARVYYNTVFDHWLLGQWLGDGDWPSRVERLRDQLDERKISHIYVHRSELDRYRQTYDRESQFSRFITPGLFERLVDSGLLRPARVPVGDAPVAVFEVVQRSDHAPRDEATLGESVHF